MASNDPEGAPEDSKEPKEQPKPMSKLVRVMTVFAYLSSVSMAAVLLSIYYLCIWKSPVLSDLEDTNTSHLQGESFEYQTGYANNDSAPFNSTGGSGISVNDNDIQLPPSSVGYSEDQASSKEIDTTITESTTLSNSTEHHNESTEASLASTNETREKRTITV